MGRRLDALEEHLGVKLLVRTTRRITPHARGQRFSGRLPACADRCGQCRGQCLRRGRQGHGHLRITAPAGFGRRHVAPLVPRFYDLHPEVTISLNLSDRVVDLAAEGYDCAVRVGDLPDSSLVSVRLADNRRLCVAAPRLSGRAWHATAPRELAQHRCLTLSSDASQIRGWAFRLPRPRRRQRGGCTSSPAAPWIAPTAKCCTTGAWTAGALPGAAPGRSMPTSPPGAWCRCWKTFAAPPNGIYMVFPQRKHMPLRVRLWIDFLKMHYERPEFWRQGVIA